MIIGVDNGNANTKTKNCIFASGIKKYELKPPIATDLIHYDNHYYVLTGDRGTYKQEKTRDETTFVLTLFALAKEILATNQYRIDSDVELVVGLPPGHFSYQKEQFENYFKSKGEFVSFEYSDKTVKNLVFNIRFTEVIVLPQAFSAVATRQSKLKDYSRTYLVDIGGYTTDVLLLSNGQPDLEYCHSIDLGIITMSNSITNSVSNQYGIKMSEVHVLDILLKRKHVFQKEIVNHVFEQARNRAQEILFKLREYEIDLRANPVIFMGGGALLLKPYFTSSDQVSAYEFIEDLNANAIGYEEIASLLINSSNGA